MTFSLIIETENLGMAGIDDLRDTLDSLKRQTYPVTNAREIYVIASGHVTEETAARLRAEYPWVTVHHEKHSLEYVESKKCGAELATSDVVIFADSDVVYQDTWLENILKGFEVAPGAAIVAGDTRIRGTSLYATAIQLVWMMDAEPQRPYPRMVQHFDLNNFAIKREVLLHAPAFSGLPLYRAHTVEMRKQLYAQGYSAIRVPGATGYHLPPGNLADLWYRLLIYGSDAVAKADYYFLYGAQVIKKPSPVRRILRVPLFIAWKLYVLARRILVLSIERPSRIPALLLAVPLALCFLSVVKLGCEISLFNRTYLFNLITSRETSHVV